MKNLLILLIALLLSGLSYGQLSVTVSGTAVTSPALAGSYTSLADALTALNGITAFTTPGNIVLTCAAGSETAPVSGFTLGSATLNPLLSATNSITIIKGSGTVTLNAGVGVSTPSSATPDGIFKLVGADFVTIDGLTFTDGNTTNPASMEFGLALFKRAAGDGCNNNTIQNCFFNMQRVNNASGSSPMIEGSVGILVINSAAGAATTSLTPTNGGTVSSNGTNSGNKFYANTINGGNYGIGLAGYAATSGVGPAPNALTFLGDLGNDIGGVASVTGNIITNYGGGGTSNPAAAIRANNQWGINISYNTINNNNGSGVNHASTLRGIFAQAGTSANATISNNTITIQSGATTSACTAIDNVIGSTAASNTVVINNNIVYGAYTTATSGVFTGISNTSTAATVNINGNTVTGTAPNSLAGTGTHVMIETGSPVTVTANNNYIHSLSRGGASGSWRGIKTTSPTNLTINGNTIENLSWTAVASTGGIDAIYSFSSAVNVTANNNIIRNLSTPSTGTITGINEYGVTGLKTFQGNQIYNFFTTSGGAGGATFRGISESTGSTADISGNLIYGFNSTGTTGGTSGTIVGITFSGTGTAYNIYKNKIYDLSSTSTNPVVYGINMSSATTANIYNNLIGDLRAPAANAGNPVIGINLSGGTTALVYYNTIRLNCSSSGALFGTSGIYFGSSTPALTLRNNIIVNTSSYNGTGQTVALRRSGGTTGTIPSNYTTASNNNDFYAGIPGSSNLLYAEGISTLTNPMQTLSALKTFMSTRDQASISENPPFLSTTGSSADFLHVSTAIETAVESGAVNIAGFVDDYDGNVRYGNPGYSGSGTAPDMGADEFAGMPLQGCTGTPASSSIVGASAVCANSGTTLTLSTLYTETGITYQWYSSTTQGGPYSTLLGTASGQPTGALTQATYYICTITCTNSSESFTTAEKEVLVNALPTVTVNPVSGSYCTPGGSPVSLTASGAGTYTWSPAAGLNATTGETVLASPSSTTTYTVTGTDVNGCQGTATAAISVGAYPTLSSVSATPASICSGGTSQLLASASVPSLVKDYSFSAGTGATLDPMTGATTLISTGVDDTPNGTPQNIGFTFNFNGVNYTQYSVSPDGWILLGGATASSQYTNSVTSTSNIPKLYPYWDDLATGTSGNVKTLLTGSAPNRIFIVQWYVTIPRVTGGAANSTFQAWLYEATGAVEFRYGTMGTGSMSASVGLTGNATNFNCVTISSGTNSTSAANDANAGQPAVGTIYTFAPPQPTYLWSPAAGLIPNETVANPQTPALTENTTYTVVVSNGTCSVSGNATVSLADPLSASVNSPNRCTGAQPTALTGVPTGGAPAFTYTWSPLTDLYTDPEASLPYDGSPLSSPTIYTATNSTITYTLTITDNCSTIAEASSVVTVYTTPSATASNNGPLCPAQELVLTGTTDIGTSFTWTGPGGFNASSLIAGIPSVVVSNSGTYTFVATANGCNSIPATTDVTVNPNPAITFSPAAPAVCEGGIVELNVASGTEQTILSEDFNGSVPGWTTINNSTGGTPANAAWSLYLSSPTFQSNDNSIFVLSNSDAQGSGSTTRTELLTPVINTTGYTSLSLSFWHYFRIFATGEIGKVEVSKDGGTTWEPTALATYTTTQGAATAWVQASIDMSAYINEPNLKIRFNYYAVWGYYWGIDNVSITGIVPASNTWSPYTDLYTTPAATPGTEYTGGPANTLWSKPVAPITYTVTATTLAGCSSTAQVNLQIDPPAVGGVITPAMSTTCSTGTGTLTLSGNTGSVVKWESSTDNGATWTDINNTTTSLTYTNLPQTTIFRALVHSGACADEEYSSEATVYTGVITTVGSPSVCLGQQVLVPVTVKSYKDVGTISLTMNYDPLELDSAGVIYDGIPGSWTKYCSIHNGVIKFSGIGPDFTLPDNAVLFTMVFNSIGTLSGGTSIVFDDPEADPIRCEYASSLFGFAPFCDMPTADYYKNGTITVNPLPVCSITGNDGPVCPALSITYTAPSGMANYTWSISGNGTINGADNLSSVEVISGTICGDAYTLSLTITSSLGCVSNCSKTVVVNDTELPVITLTAAATLGCNPTQAQIEAAFGTASVTDNCSTSLVAVGTVEAETGSGCTYSTTKNWTVTDACNNTGVASQTITYTRDTEAPQITLLPAATLGCNPTLAEIEAAFGAASVSDNCTSGLVAAGTVEAETGSGCTYATTKNWTVTDDCGNPATASQTVTYTRDTEAPQITLLPAATLGCNPTLAEIEAAFGAASVSDNCSSGLVATGLVGAETGSGCTYSTTKSWSVTDDCGNPATATQTVTYTRDTEAPQITLLPAATLGCNPTLAEIKAAFGAASVSDNCSSGLVATGIVEAETGSGCTYSTTKNWSVTDDCGNPATATQTVTYTRDTEAPQITLLPAATLGCNPTLAEIEAAFGAASVSDNCSSGLVASGTVEAETGSGCTWSTTKNWTVTDDCGNPGTASQTVTYTRDTEPPQITLLPAATLGCNPTLAEIEAAFGAASVSDNCSSGLVATGVVEAETGSGCTWSTTKSWTVTDDCGNPATASQTVTYTRDLVNPEIFCPADITINANSGCGATIADLGTPVTSDNCSVADVSNNHPSNFYPMGETLVTWTVTDGCGNTAFCVQKVTVVGNSLSGVMKYYKPGGTDLPLTNVELWLMDGATHIGTATTAAGTGAYSFNNLCAGTYTIVVNNNNKLPGSINSTDAGQVNQWGTLPVNIEMVRFLAGDANGSSQITAGDAQLIQKYFVYGPPAFTFVTPWSYWQSGALVNTNPPAPAPFNVNVSGGDVTNYNIYGMVTGDFNGSYTPGPAKSTASSLILTYGGSVTAGAGQDLDLPLRAATAMEVGAISLVMNIPSDLVEVTAVRVNGSNDAVTYAVNGNELRIGWNSLEPVNMAAGDELVVLSLRTKETFTDGQSILVSLTSDPMNELADGNFEVIEGAELVVDVVENLATGMGETGMQALQLGNYPNPFNKATTITYTIPVNGKVILSINNMLGQTVETLVEETLSAGSYTVKLDAAQLQQGIYFVILRLTTDKGELSRSIKLVVNK